MRSPASTRGARASNAPRRTTAVMTSITIAMLLLAACGGGDGPQGAGGSSPVPTGRQAQDPQLVDGRRVFVASCARCHGARGEGRIGPRLAGRVAERFPDVDDQISFVTEGKGLMPGFGNLLTDEEIEAVVRYEREVL